MSYDVFLSRTKYLALIDLLEKCQVSGEALLKFLKRYRETPDSTPGVTGIPSMDPRETFKQREVWK